MSALPRDEPPDPVPFAEIIDWARGTSSAHGRLTVQGADLIRGAAEVLRRSGHLRITVDLHAARTADAAGVDVLRSVAAGMRAHRSELVLLFDGEEKSS